MYEWGWKVGLWGEGFSIQKGVKHWGHYAARDKGCRLGSQLRNVQAPDLTAKSGPLGAQRLRGIGVSGRSPDVDVGHGPSLRRRAREIGEKALAAPGALGKNRNTSKQ